MIKPVIPIPIPVPIRDGGREVDGWQLYAVLGVCGVSILVILGIMIYWWWN